jgi:hypothetical protein
MTTAADLFMFINNGIDQSYSDFLNIPRANRLLRESEIRVAESHYRKNRTQKQADEISPLTVLDSSIPVRNNRFRTTPLRVTALTVVGTTATITFEEPHQLLATEAFTLADTQGFTPSINGNYTVATVTSTTQLTFTVVPVTGTWTSGTGEVSHGFMFADMIHPLAIRTTFVGTDNMAIQDVIVNANPYLKFTRPNYVRDGSLIRVTGTLGVTGLIGDFYCKFRNRTSYFLYTDEALTIPAVLSGTYQGSGVVNLIVTEQATILRPDARISASTQETDEWTPKFGVSENGINLYPRNKVCDSVEVDYVKDPPIVMDVVNTTLDLELYYNFKYLMRVKDEAVNIFLLQMRELPTAQAEITTTQMNP